MVYLWHLTSCGTRGRSAQSGCIQSLVRTQVADEAHCVLSSLTFCSLPRMPHDRTDPSC